MGEKSHLENVTNSSSFTKKLFVAETRRLDNLLQKIIDKNCWLTGTNNSTGVMYNGTKHYVKRGVCTLLDTSLEPMMLDYLQQLANLHKEATEINQLVLMLTANCVTEQDVRDALPDCLLQQDKDSALNQLPRKKPFMWNLTNKQKLICAQSLPTLEYFAATHLLF